MVRVRVGKPVTNPADLQGVVALPMADVTGWGLLDTGASHLVVSPIVIMALGITKFHPAKSTTTRELSNVSQCDVSLLIFDDTGSIAYVEPSIRALVADTVLPFGCLVGMAILQHAELHVYGSQNRFEIAF